MHITSVESNRRGSRVRFASYTKIRLGLGL